MDSNEYIGNPSDIGMRVFSPTYFFRYRKYRFVCRISPTFRSLSKPTYVHKYSSLFGGVHCQKLNSLGLFQCESTLYCTAGRFLMTWILLYCCWSGQEETFLRVHQINIFFSSQNKIKSNSILYTELYSDINIYRAKKWTTVEGVSRTLPHC